MEVKDIDRLSVSAIRALVIDVTNNARSGHPGMALGSAPMLYVLFKNHLIGDPSDPKWCNRDRFVLSAGHASALLYILLHLSGYGISLDDLRKFRSLGSITPGHPEYGLTPGVEATTGPLAQGLAQAVGMAFAERAVGAQYREGRKLIDHYTYALVGDGCLEEGLSQEAITLAGHHRLNKLIVFYDSNHVTLDGSLDLSYSGDMRLRFIAAGWDVLEVKDGNDMAAIDAAITAAKRSLEKPTLIIVSTIIGYGSEKQGTSKVHGSPLGEEDGKKAKESYGYHYPEFTMPPEVYANFSATFTKRGKEAHAAWDAFFAEYERRSAQDAEVFRDAFAGNVEKYIFKSVPVYGLTAAESTRKTSGRCLNALHQELPFLMGGSADVASSVMTKLEHEPNFARETPFGRNICFGVREFGMAAVQNGMLLHGGLRTYAGCFLVFSDYLKPALRLAALSKIPAIYLFSHDSIALGEDGPTHQPVEQLAMLRSVPNVTVIRPCDARETYAAWKCALTSRHTPTCLILSRQNLPLIEGSSFDLAQRGGYAVKDEKDPDALIIATGSEVSLALQARLLLLERGVKAKVVSMPSIELFKKQDEGYRRSVLSLPRDRTFAVEMLSPMPWHEFAGHVMGVTSFGASAPGKDVVEHFGFTPEKLAGLVLAGLGSLAKQG